ncbi:alpha/beta fold hydrolase [Nocardioides pantholopis]|uniref:alpha/beta fold hydrolase n=1 Tax=Nocardioides pantholopis TaxID=2483798 RepID=UPI0013E339E2|nr:alpha/beta hydrolase [Nocardioides pantholopis]
MRIRSGYVDAAWGQVHYRAAGDSGPWVALFHESPLSCRVYDDVLRELGTHCRAVAFDTPGYGASEPPVHDRFEIPDYAAVLGEAAHALGMRDAVLGGVHTGASLAIEAAHAVPGLAAGVFLSGVALFSADERAEMLASWAPDVAQDLDGTQFAWAVERYRRIWPALTAPMLHTAVVEVMRVAERYNWGYNAAFRHDPAQPLADLRVPVLLLDAEHDMLADKDPLALALARSGRLEVLPGLPGQPHLRAPQEYAAHIRDFALEVSGACPR